MTTGRGGQRVGLHGSDDGVELGGSRRTRRRRAPAARGGSRRPDARHRRQPGGEGGDGLVGLVIVVDHHHGRAGRGAQVFGIAGVDGGAQLVQRQVPDVHRRVSTLRRAVMDPSASATARWAASGAMALTGRPDGPPLVAPAGVALAAAMGQWADDLAAVTPAWGGRCGSTDRRSSGAGGPGWAVAPGRHGAGGAARLVPVVDGWMALALARVDDVAALPAWLRLTSGRPWPGVVAAVGSRPGAAGGAGPAAGTAVLDARVGAGCDGGAAGGARR